MTPERLHDLLADNILNGLDAAESGELHRLLQSTPDADERAFDALVARLDAALPVEPLPPRLASKLEADAARVVVPTPARRRGPPGFIAWAGWAVAMTLAMAAWLNRPNKIDPTDLGRDALVLAATDPGTKAVVGEVVWSGAKQAGYMRLTGLPANDPAVAQYQLWIFDANRDKLYPVDGGVFDVPSGGGVVPVRAKLPVASPTLFAVTREKPGGVVVSSREHIVLVAKVP